MAVEGPPLPALLLDLPGISWEALWRSLQAQDRLNLFQTCRSVQSKVLGSCSQASFSSSLAKKDVCPSALAKLTAVLSRRQPLEKLSLQGSSSNYGHGGPDQFLFHLQKRVVAAHAASAPGSAPPPAAACLKELVLEVRACLSARRVSSSKRTCIQQAW